MPIERWSQQIKEEVFDQSFGSFDKEAINIPKEEFAAHIGVTTEELTAIQYGGFKQIEMLDLKWYISLLKEWTEPIRWKDEKPIARHRPLVTDAQEVQFNMWAEITADSEVMDKVAKQGFSKNELEKSPWNFPYRTLHTIYTKHIEPKKETQK